MASSTKRVKRRRILRIGQAGRKRKNAERNYGSTAPNLPLDKPNANEKAQAKK